MSANNIKVPVLTRLTAFQQALNNILQNNELKGGYGAYELSFAQGNRHRQDAGRITI